MKFIFPYYRTNNGTTWSEELDETTSFFPLSLPDLISCEPYKKARWNRKAVFQS